MTTPLPNDYQNAFTPTGALTELPATGPRGINAINNRINANPVVYAPAATGVPATDTAALQAAINTGRPVYILPGNNYVVTALTPLSNSVICGGGHDSQISFATPNSALITLTSAQKNVQFQDLRLTLTAAATGSTLVDLSGTFKHSFRGVIFEGQHTDASVSTFKTQTGIKLRNNAGDNCFTDKCEFNNLGNSVRTDSIQNHFADCLFSACWKGVIGGDPTGVAFAAGISMTNCNFVGGHSTDTLTTDSWIEVTGSANVWWLENIWIEGCDRGIVIGNGTFGPAGFGISNAKVAAVTKLVDIVASRQTYLANVRFDQDPSGTPTSLTINATNATSGFAANLITTVGGATEIPASTFPAGWAYFSRLNETSLIPGSLTTPAIHAPAVYTTSVYDAARGYASFSPMSEGTPPTTRLEFWSSDFNPSIVAAGTPTNVAVYCKPKGNGTFSLFMGAAQPTATISAEGVATDVDLNFIAQGAGRVRRNSQLVDAEQFITLTSTYTLTSQTAAQKLFNTSTNGQVTLPVGTYYFECFFDLSSMSASSGGFGWDLTAGTATISGIKWWSTANKAALSTAASAQETVNTAANTAIVTATTNTVGWARITGKVRTSVAGTVIPKVSLGVAAAAVVGVDSYFRIWNVGSNTVTSDGSWS